MMEDILIFKGSAVINNYRKAVILPERMNIPEEISKDPVTEKLYSEGGEMFFQYMKRLGLGNEKNIMVLSARRQYYDHKDFSGITALINQKKLNFMKHLDSFLHIVHTSLSEKASLIGCFLDRNKKNKYNNPVPLYKRYVCIPGSELSLEINKTDVSELLESHGFKVLDMTDIRGLTYFRAQKLVRNKNNYNNENP